MFQHILLDTSPEFEIHVCNKHSSIFGGSFMNSVFICDFIPSHLFLIRHAGQECSAHL